MHVESAFSCPRSNWHVALFVLNECGADLGLELLKVLFPKYTILSWSPMSPYLIGYCDRRPRRLTAMHKKGSVICDATFDEFGEFNTHAWRAVHISDVKKDVN